MATTAAGILARARRIGRAPGEAWAFAQLPPIARAVIRERLTYLSPVKMLELQRAVRDVDAATVPGDVVEFGVALGGSGIALSHTASTRAFHGFDLFGLIPPPSSDKDGERAVQRYEVIASGLSAGIRGDEYYGYLPDLLGTVKASFTRHGLPVDGGRIALHPGLFDEGWPLASPSVQAIALAHVDCDWYDPVRYCLDAIAPLISPRGIIVLDDYLDYDGCRAATDEFLTAHAEFSVRHRRGNVSLVKSGAVSDG
ncbi:TylF/MycF/NovP-related O-methyltransferase [Demequina muriae]|uniref:TylF/MycF/NovP-related O-methyltransferase n=1 Tax=Demequina muriae TaxID=3051664 RepID=A0ABT8GJM0_9MICO|nr:TylF/MycF/NovP-related O-methyltransferase [Demequina sp. EGI L300058]MDN4481628.1 TylF/MycF/NovP-related O-methyltransferase [Demequina sp. EGI L300058]